VEPDESGAGIYPSDVAGVLASVRHARTLILGIESPGGLMRDAKKIYALIRSHPAPYKSAVVRIAASAAWHLVLACDRRFAEADATLLIHRAAIDRTGSGRRWTAAKHQATAEHLESRDDEIAKFYAWRTGRKVSAEWFRREMRSENQMPLATALECGLIHKVLAPPPRPAPRSLPGDTSSPHPAIRPQQAAAGVPYFTRDMRAPGIWAGQ
jgi:ATP-dependent protease ClpP protease subunit